MKMKSLKYLLVILISFSCKAIKASEIIADNSQVINQTANMHLSQQETIKAHLSIPEVINIIDKGSIDDIKKMLQQGLSPNGDYGCRSMLTIAIQSIITNPNTSADEVIKKMQAIVEAGGDVNQCLCDGCVLSAAVSLPFQFHNTELEHLLYLLYQDHQNMINHINGNCDKSRPFCFDSLKEAKQFLYVMNQEQMDVFHLDLLSSLIKITDFLISNGADVNQYYKGVTPLGFALKNPTVTGKHILKYLISNGADVNAKYDDGYTPLFLAYAYDNTDAIQILLNAGADPNVVNNKGLRYNQIDKE